MVDYAEFSFKANGHNVTILCTYKSGRYGFSHIANLIIDGWGVEEASAHWVNRSWECFHYETAARNVINKRADLLFNITLRHWKESKNVERMTKARKAEFMRYYYALEFSFADELKTLARCTNWIDKRATTYNKKPPRFNLKRDLYAPAEYKRASEEVK